mmetsp:Transcript_47217/g.125420  ORF Transcript_47217/g.125420 Transcript_47217/m.125420 type:complete len:128 (-) Transcript_47217:138-521(-)
MGAAGGKPCCCTSLDSTVVAEITPKALLSTSPVEVPTIEASLIGVRVGFDTADGVEVVVLSQRPLGFKYTKTVPLTITDVKPQSHGHMLGIKKGWMIRSIGGEDMTGKSTDHVHGELRKQAAVLPLV